MVFLRSRLTPFFGSSKVQVEMAFSRRNSARHQAQVIQFAIISDKAYDIFLKLYGIFEKQTYSLFWLFQGLGRDGLLEEAQCKALGTGVCLARRRTVQQGTRELRREPLSESSKHVPTFFKVHLPDKPPRKRTNSPVQAFFWPFCAAFFWP